MTIEEKLERDSALFRLEKAERERDEAREVATGLLAHLQAAWEVVGDQAQAISQTIAVQKKEVTHSANRFYPWLKQQPTVDEEEGSTVDLEVE